MYTRFQMQIAEVMSWAARALAVAIAIYVLASAGREFIGSESASPEVSWSGIRTFLVAALIAAGFLSVWRFEIAGAALICLGTFWMSQFGLAHQEVPNHLVLVFLLPAFLSLGAWLRRAEYRVHTNRNHSARAN